jgi:hypothetical protein
VWRRCFEDAFTGCKSGLKKNLPWKWRAQIPYRYRLVNKYCYGVHLVEGFIDPVLLRSPGIKSATF